MHLRIMLKERNALFQEKQRAEKVADDKHKAREERLFDSLVSERTLNKELRDTMEAVQLRYAHLQHNVTIVHGFEASKVFAQGFESDVKKFLLDSNSQFAVKDPVEGCNLNIPVSTGVDEVTDIIRECLDDMPTGLLQVSHSNQHCMRISRDNSKDDIIVRLNELAGSYGSTREDFCRDSLYGLKCGDWKDELESTQ